MKENNIEFDFEIVPSPKTSGYRNKMEFSFGDSGLGSELELGMRKMNSFYEVVTSKNCNIIDNDFKLILLETLDFFKNSDDSFYHKKNHEGSLRHLVLRKGEFTGEIFINLVSTSALKTDPWLFAECIKNLNTQQKIVSISHSVNDSVSDIVQAEKFTLLYGRDYFFEEINNLKFKIFPFSFFQTNSSGAEKLYNTVCEFAGDLAGKTVFDLYCGTGTIAQIISKNAKKVYGIEIVNEAVEAAKANADLNNIKNCEFIAGDVLKKIDELSIKPDLIILDPPRDGVHPKAIEKIISFNAKEILYISCKPSSLARDLNIFLENHYKIEKIICHDMFSKTYHVETIVLMQRVEMA